MTKLPRHIQLSLGLGFTLMLACVTTANALTVGGGLDHGQVILKSGSLTLIDDSQTKSGEIFSYDDDSTRAYAIEVGSQPNPGGGLVFGAEWLFYSHDWVSTEANSGELETGAVLANMKRYFSVRDRIWPFIGVGIGFSGAQLQRDAGRNSEGLGFAFQAMAGVQVNLSKDIFIYAEAKGLSSTITNIFSTSIDVSSKSTFVGIGFTY